MNNSEKVNTNNGSESAFKISKNDYNNIVNQMVENRYTIDILGNYIRNINDNGTNVEQQNKGTPINGKKYLIHNDNNNGNNNNNNKIDCCCKMADNAQHSSSSVFAKKNSCNKKNIKSKKTRFIKRDKHTSFTNAENIKNSDGTQTQFTYDKQPYVIQKPPLTNDKLPNGIHSPLTNDKLPYGIQTPQQFTNDTNYDGSRTSFVINNKHSDVINTSFANPKHYSAVDTSLKIVEKTNDSFNNSDDEYTSDEKSSSCETDSDINKMTDTEKGLNNAYVKVQQEIEYISKKQKNGKINGKDVISRINLLLKCLNILDNV